MQSVPIPLFSEVYRNVDGTVAKDTAWSLINGYRDDLGAINSRPGLRFIDSFHPSRGSPINGLYWWDKKKLLIVSAGQRVSSLSYNGSNFSIADLTSDTLNVAQRTSFASDGTYLFMANGGRIAYTDGTSSTTYIADGDCPTSVSHLAWLDGYLLALSDNVIYYSEVNDSLTWTATDFFTNPGDPDNTIAMLVKQREIYLFGTSSIEIWENDGESPFIRVPGGFIPVGCIAKDSIVTTDTGILWLDSNRRFSRFSGRNPEVISSPYDREIQNFGDVSDCVGYRVIVDGMEFVLWSFNSPNRTLVYNPRLNDWYEWGTWNSTAGKFDRFVASSGAFCPAWGKVMVGSFQQPYLYEMRADEYDDDGTAIRVVRQSGHINYGSTKNKRSEQIRIGLRRGDQDNSYSTPPEVMLRWRDDNRSTWGQERRISLGAPGESDKVRRLFRTGIYRTRQYELSFTAGTKFVVSDAEEELETLR